MQWWPSLKRTLKYNYLRIMRLKASTHDIALGLALGIFVGFLPIIPFQTVVALAFAFVFRASKIPAAVGTWISNPINLIPFYTMLYYVGRWLLPMEAPNLDFHHLELKSMIEQGWGLVVVMFAGGVLLGIPGAFITYILTFRAVNGYRQKRMIRLIKKYNRKKAAREVAESAEEAVHASEQNTEQASEHSDFVSSDEKLTSLQKDSSETGISPESRH